MVCAAALLPALMAGQGQQPPLSYHGWALGISLDSARKLTEAQIAKPLVCVGMDTQTMFCETNGRGAHASLYFSPVPRHLDEMLLQAPFDRRASRDSVKQWFTARWGQPIPREVIGSKSASDRGEPVTDALGSWARPGMVFGMAAISSLDSSRTLSVTLYSPAREIRLMQQRADTSKRR